VLEGGVGYVIDLDPGQQTIGIPTTISAGLISQGTENEVKAKRMFFVGATTPSLCKAEILCAAETLKVDGMKGGGKTIIVDTSGMIRGVESALYKFMKTLILKPNIVFAIERYNGELSHIIRLIEKISHVELLERPEGAKETPPEERARMRTKKFKEYFADSKHIFVRDLTEASEGDVVGFFRGRYTEAVGLVDSVTDGGFIVKVPKSMGEWDFVIKGKIKIQLS
jgi:polynucleotide 5'-kinase involved in rRNA processing